MGYKIRKTLNNLLCGIPLVLMSFLPMKSANGQIPKAKNMSMIEADKEMNIAQNRYPKRPNTLYFMLQPGDLGFGIRYDRKISPLGLYSSFSRGNYRFGNGAYIKNHLKIALGGKIYGKCMDFNGSRGFLSRGILYHTYGEKNYDPIFINPKGTKHFSGEFGGGVDFERFSGALRFDPFKWEGSWDFGIKF